MELDITDFFTEQATQAFEYSGSVAERGKNAAKETWCNAIEQAKSAPLLSTPDALETFRKYMKGFGAWDDEEIKAWTDDECNALLVQLIAGDIREAGLDTDEPDWTQYNKDSEAGLVSGRIMTGDDRRIYYYIGD